MGDPVQSEMLSVTGGKLGYQPDHPLLEGCELQAQAGELVALIGRNGSGKSTLLKTILGMLPMLDGTCRIKGNRADALDRTGKARLISFVSSGLSVVPPVTVRELVALGRIPHTGWFGRLGKRDLAMVERALEQVGITLLAGRRADRLSDGERQRALIARALAQETDLMLLDEPAAYLDIAGRFELMGIMAGYREKGNAVVYSTHDLESAMLHADRLWVIREGRVLQGAPEDLGLTGLFGELFPGGAISFDANLRRFSRRRQTRGPVHLRGEGADAVLWTRNALDRLGFEEGPPGCRVQVTVRPSDGGHAWLVRIGREEYACENIYRLARVLHRCG